MTRERKLTGWHVLAIFTASFGVIIAVNLVLAWNAVSTFPGLEVKNGYIASQTFDKRRAVQEALGWSVEADEVGGKVYIYITGKDGSPVQVGSLNAVVGRPTSVREDQAPEFAFDGTAYVARADLAPGRWDVRMKATALDGTPFEKRVVLHVKD